MNALLIIVSILITYYLAQYTHFNSKCYIFENRYEIYINLIEKLKAFFNKSNNLQSRLTNSDKIKFSNEGEEFEYFEANGEYANELALLYEEIRKTFDKTLLIFPENYIIQGIKEVEQHVSLILDYICSPTEPDSKTIFGNIVFDELPPNKDKFEHSKNILFDYIYKQKLLKLLEPHIKLPIMPTERLCQRMTFLFREIKMKTFARKDQL